MLVAVRHAPLHEATLTIQAATAALLRSGHGVPSRRKRFARNLIPHGHRSGRTLVASDEFIKVLSVVDSCVATPEATAAHS